MRQEQELFEFTNQHLYKHVHNHTEINRKSNVKLTVLNNGKAVTNFLYNNVIAVKTPVENVFFYLFIVNNNQISSIFAEEKVNNGWVNAQNMSNDNHVFCECFTADHLAIPKKITWFKHLKDGRSLVAISKDILISNLKGNPTKLYMTAGYDPDEVSTRTTYCSSPTDTSELVTIQNLCNAGKGILTINGYVYPTSKLNDVSLASRDSIELTVDNDIEFSLVLDSNSYVRQAYQSNEFSYDIANIPAHVDMTNPPEPYNLPPTKLFKDILRIPKDIAGNRLITYDTITIILRDKITQRGVFIPFTGERSISQLTRNIFGLTSYITDASIDFLKTDDPEIVIYVANYNKDQVVETNGSYTEILDLFDEDQILNLLVGDLQPPVDIWSAQKLETSSYIKTMMSMTNMQKRTSTAISQQVQALGIHKYCAVNAPLVHDGGLYNDGLLVNKPHFLRDIELKPLLFVDGIKVHNEKCTHVNYSNYVDIDIVNTDLTHESKIDYRLIRSGETKHWYVDVKNTNVVLVDTDKELQFYRVEKSTKAHSLFNTDTVYVEVALSEIGVENVSNGVRSIIFSPALYDSTFIIIERHYNDESYFEVNTNNLEAFTFIPTKNIQGHITPLFKDGNFLVFLNGYALIECIDYLKYIIRDEESRIFGIAISIQSLDRVLVGNNRIEIYRVDERLMTRNANFMGDINIPVNDSNSIYCDGVTSVITDGRIRSFGYLNPGFDSYTVNVNPETVYGLPYEIKTLVDRELYDYIKPFDYATRDLEYNQMALFRASYHSYSESPSFIIPRLTRIFSTWLSTIVNDILSGDLKVEFFNNDQDILAQIQQYEWLKDFDVMFNSSCIRSQFVEYEPHYFDNMAPKDTNDRRYIERLIEIIGMLYNRPDSGIQGQILFDLTNALCVIDFYEQHDDTYGRKDHTCHSKPEPAPNPALKAVLISLLSIAQLYRHDVISAEFTCDHIYEDTNRGLLFQLVVEDLNVIALRAVRDKMIGDVKFSCEHTAEPSDSYKVRLFMESFRALVLLSYRETRTNPYVVLK